MASGSRCSRSSVSGACSSGLSQLLFETTDTIRYQVQEMMRAEKIVREMTFSTRSRPYNQLLGNTRELGCTLFIELDEPVLRAERLKEWLSLPDHLYFKTDDGTKFRPRYDRAQVDEDRLSSCSA